MDKYEPADFAFSSIGSNQGLGEDQYEIGYGKIKG